MSEWLRDESGRVDIKRLVDEDGQQTHQMCCICFDYIPVDELWVDDNGDKWDVCPDCNLSEQIAAKLKEENRGRERDANH